MLKTASYGLHDREASLSKEQSVISFLDLNEKMSVSSMLIKENIYRTAFLDIFQLLSNIFIFHQLSHSVAQFEL